MKTNLPLMLAVAVTAAVAIPAASALAGGPVATAAATHVVKLKNVAINPSRLTIKAGDRVTWQFLDGPSTEHTVTPEKRAGGLHFTGTGAHFNGSYSVTFKKKGTYYYQCTIHPGMQGRIVVH
jgi:plastocyanin